MMSVGRRRSERHRIAAGLSQETLAERTGLSVARLATLNAELHVAAILIDLTEVEFQGGDAATNDL